MSDVHLVLCLVLAFSIVVGLVLPGWPRPIRRATNICIGLLALSGLAFAGAVAFAAISVWPGVPICATVCLASVFIAFWFAASPEDTDEDEDDGGGGPRKDDPVPPSPGPRADGPDPLIDWGDFDREREGWTPGRDRELVGV